jgi:hypothetical protein
MAACRYCGNDSMDNVQHIKGERKCCPDCDHRPRCIEVNGARVQVEGPVPESLVHALAVLADAVQQAFAEPPPLPRYITGS